MTPTAEAGTVGATISSWQLRAVLAIACLATTATAALWSRLGWFAIVVLLVAGAVVVIRPASHAASVFLAMTAFIVLVTDPGLTAWAMAAVLTLHATHILAALAAVVPHNTRVEFAALRPSFYRFLGVQAASQLLVLLALLTVA